jgi:hypothetical protein
MVELRLTKITLLITVLPNSKKVHTLKIRITATPLSFNLSMFSSTCTRFTFQGEPKQAPMYFEILKGK